MDYSLGEYIANQMCDFSEGDFGIKKSLMGLGVGAALGASVLGGVKASSSIGYNKALRPARVATLQALQDYHKEESDKNFKLSNDEWLSGNKYSADMYMDRGFTHEEASDAARYAKGGSGGSSERVTKELDKLHKGVPKETAKGAGAGAGLGAGLVALGKVISDKKKKKKVTKENK